MRGSLGLVLAFVLLSCGPLTPSASTPPAGLDPIVKQHLQLNNATFVTKVVPMNPATSADRAVAVASKGLTGVLTASHTLFGDLHAPLLGQRSDRTAWLVELDGLAPPALPGGPTPIGPRRTFAFIDAEDALPLMQVAEGAGPP